MVRVGKVEPGMPEVSLPPFEIFYHNRTLSFTEVCTELGSGIIVVPLVAVLANVAIAKAFSKLIIFFLLLFTAFLLIQSQLILTFLLN